MRSKTAKSVSAVFRNGMKMAVLAACLLSVPGLAAAADFDKAATIKTYQYHADAAYAFAGADFAQVAKRRLAIPPKGVTPKPSAMLFDKTAVGPVKVFDNLYYVGYKGTGAFVLTTSDGIIVIDAMNDDYDAEQMIVGGMKKLGLDPAQIKYVLLSHGHPDHYGGARYLNEHYGARVLMHEIDWDYMEELPDSPYFPDSPKPERDTYVFDKQKLTLGDTTISIFLTPGHTPGGISLILPVKDGGQTHMAALWGGTGFPEELEMKWEYLKSLEYFAEFTKQANVDVKLCTHPYNENSLEYMKALSTRKPGEPHPFIIGRETYSRYEGLLMECVKANIAAQMQAE